MIPRKLARRILREFIDTVVYNEDCVGDATDPAAAMAAVADDLIASSDLVLRGAENVEQKARRYLTEGRVVVTEIRDDGTIIGRARGSAGEEYALGYAAASRRWGCTCPVKGPRCSHLVALRLVVDAPTASG